MTDDPWGLKPLQKQHNIWFKAGIVFVLIGIVLQLVASFKHEWWAYGCGAAYWIAIFIMNRVHLLENRERLVSFREYSKLEREKDDITVAWMKDVTVYCNSRNILAPEVPAFLRGKLTDDEYLH
jgi:hypothetical protein